jgi:hypothetical protein
MKTISLICAVVALGVPALASAQRGGAAAAPMRSVQIQRLDNVRTITPARDFAIRRGDAVRGETGTRIARRRAFEPNRRRPHNPARRRYYNATH